MTKILAINSGSSSLKFQLFEMPEETVITKGLVERIGLEEGIFTISVNGEKITEKLPIPSHEVAVEMLLDKLTSLDIVASLNDIEGVGHRVVHGGELFDKSVVVTDEVLEKLDTIEALAPLHNPANIRGVRAFQQILPNVINVLTFDTAFHQTMPKKNYLYATPLNYYTDYGVRKYGMHGTSHQYVAGRAAAVLERPIEELKIITCHIGSGASVCAIDGGKSVDTSMGFTPLQGLMMGTRTGDIDVAVIPYLMQKTGKTAEELITVFNFESGLKGLSQVSSDSRDVEEAAEAGNQAAQDALDVFDERIRKYIGAYAATMNGVDAIVFTAGVGENSKETRKSVIDGVSFLGVKIDDELNNCRGVERVISTADSKVKVLIIPTDEEVMIARDTFKLK